MSLRLRLLLAVGAVAFVALAAADVATYSSFRSFLYQRVDQSLLAGEAGVSRLLEPQDHGGHDTFATVAPGTFLQLRDQSGSAQTVAAAGSNDGASRTPRLPTSITGLTADGDGDARRFLTVPSIERGGPSFRVLATARGDGQLILAVPLSDTVDSLHRLLGIEVAVTSIALLAAALLGWWLVRVGLQPLVAMEEAADAIAEGDLERRVPDFAASTEVGRLAGALNTMLGRIRAAFNERDATEAELRRSETRLRRFVADASHELRTPLAAVAAYAELYERGGRSRPDDLARLIAGIRLEAGRMGVLVDDLLLLARLDEGRPLESKPVELVALAADAVTAGRAVGPRWPITLDAAAPVEVMGDATRLRQVLDNLLANVRAHTPPDTATVVRVAEVMTDAGPIAELSVTDSGPGLAHIDGDQVFERFYRADPSRSRQAGGSGLGLAIAAGIAEAHGGDIGVDTTPGGGASFVVRLPALPTSPPNVSGETEAASTESDAAQLVDHYGRPGQS